MDLGIMVSPKKPRPDTPHGEARSMGESNVLLGNRFGARHRPYVLHEAKAASMSLIRELSEMWAPHMARAATRLSVPSFRPSMASRALSGTPAVFQAEPIAENVSPQTASGRNVLDTHTVEDLHGMTASDILLLFWFFFLP